MKKSRFSDEQIVNILAEADRGTVASAAKTHSVSEQTIYTWRKRFGMMQTSEVKWLRELERENARLKKLVADRDLEIDVLKEIQSKKW